ncbi:hypothetical protein [Streptomyces iconiensis]|uniref:Tetracyclin repressor-like C-terminal domain-containing protein n=1 Tax=Streptomyces iconiensis TaxID=1384038 RepID=A0ABT6ZV10_9ACTN|nr:hypothetical protein [Streptomyces iconiensis]MDJ1132888.1 hypothetical protein [Streptomyces iconiensis]
MREHLRSQFTGDFAAHLPGDDPAVRAELLTAWIVGIEVLRSVIGTPVLASADQDDVRADFRRGVAALLHGGGQTTGS